MLFRDPGVTQTLAKLSKQIRQAKYRSLMIMSRFRRLNLRKYLKLKRMMGILRVRGERKVLKEDFKGATVNINSSRKQLKELIQII